MIICSMAGFLGSGKTTLVMDLSQKMADEGKKIAIAQGLDVADFASDAKMF